MKIKHISSFLFSSLILLGCSSVENPRIDQLGFASGGNISDDNTHLYWSTSALTHLIRSADHVFVGEHDFYHSDYRWEDKQLRELVRKGERFDSDKGKQPFELHIRFNKEGEAIYQQYRVNGKVLSLKASEIAQYQTQAKDVVNQLESQSNTKLVQGYWDGESFETCDDKEFSIVKFDKHLAPVWAERLTNNSDNYMAVVGIESNKTLSVKEVLLFDDNGYDCIDRPQLIDTQ